MPGTAVGSAPQESWHGQSLKQLVTDRSSPPYDLASKLSSQVVAWEAQKIQSMKREGCKFDDWPQAGRHLDQQFLKGDVALAKQGRSSAQKLFELRQHVRWQDPAGNAWFPRPHWRLLPLMERKNLQTWSASHTSGKRPSASCHIVHGL